jgi:glycosyltransferase involved in cell wall biosynthesis
MAIILTCYYRPKPGGFCKRLFRGLRALLDRGHTVHYLSVVPFPIDHPRCRHHRFPWPQAHTRGPLFWLSFLLAAPVWLLAIGVASKADTLLAFGHTYALILQPLRICCKLPLTVFLRADALKIHEIKGRSRLIIQVDAFLEAVGLSNTRVVTVSKSLKAGLQSRLRFESIGRIDVLPNEITTVAWASRQAVDGGGTLRMGCVGILERRKNQLLLVEAASRLLHLPIQFLFFGLGENEALLRQVIERRGVTETVRLMGWQSPERIWANIDLLLMPSLHEGAPNAVLEALGNAIPVLASDIPEHREILPPISLVPVTVDEWVMRISRIARDPQRQFQRLHRAQRSMSVRLQFDWDAAFCRLLVPDCSGSPAQGCG